MDRDASDGRDHYWMNEYECDGQLTIWDLLPREEMTDEEFSRYMNRPE